MTFSMRTVIRPHLLLDVVSGELLAGRAVVIDGNHIARVVAVGDAPAEGPAFVDLPGQTVLPGMIDCHTHLGCALRKRCRSVPWQCAGDPEAGEEP